MVNETPETARDARNAAKNFAGIEATLLRLEKSMADLNKKMDDSVNVMNKNIDDKVHALNKTIDDKIDGLREDLKDEILSKVQQNVTNIAANTSKIEQLQSTVARLENTIELNSKANDLIVKGIPVLSNERASALYQQISVALGLVPEQTPRAEVFRLGKKRVGAKWDPPLIIRFPNKYDRKVFYDKYFEHGNLKLTDVGINADQRFFISENLTKYNQDIFATAMRLKREGKLATVSTSNGEVAVKQDKRGVKVPIKVLSELDNFQ
jgi:hypothetical protein